MAMKGSAQRSVALVVVVGMLASVLLAAGVSLFASSAPDGLERVAQDTGLAEAGQDSAAADSPLADYGLAGDDGLMGSAFAGVLGVGIVAAIGFGVFMWLAPSRKDRQPNQ